MSQLASQQSRFEVNTVPQSPEPRVSIVIPIFNEAQCIAPVLEEIRTVLADRLAYEVIAVDDGSTDATPQILAAQAALMPSLRRVRHDRCYGKSAALRSGVQVARGAVIVTLDGDGQNDPTDIPVLVERLAAPTGAALGLVAGQRQRRRDGVLRRWSSTVSNAVRARVLHDAARDSACGLKAFPRHVFLALPSFEGMHRFLPALLRREGLEVTFVDVHHRPRLAGRAKYGVWDRLWVGLLDLLVVYWLVRRAHRPNAVETLSDRNGEDVA